MLQSGEVKTTRESWTSKTTAETRGTCDVNSTVTGKEGNAMYLPRLSRVGMGRSKTGGGAGVRRRLPPGVERLEDRLTLTALFGDAVPLLDASAGPLRVMEAVAADLDSDGDIDVAYGNFATDEANWLENTAGDASMFVAHSLGPAFGVKSVATADLDADGDVDVLCATWWDGAIVWFESENIAGTQIFTKRIAADDPGAGWGTSVAAADIDGDGSLDLLASYTNIATANDEIPWYRNDGETDPSFSRVLITNQVNDGRTSQAGDIDGDGDLDVVTGGAVDDTVAWFENLDGTGTFGPRRVITSNADLVERVVVFDLDNDGDADVVSASSEDDTIAWYENDGDPENPAFTTHVISTAADGASAVQVADLDADGDYDVLSSSSQDGKIAWYENDGSETFSERVLAPNIGMASSVLAVDLDQDGDLDVLATTQGSTILDYGRIVWFEQLNAVDQIDLIGDAVGDLFDSETLTEGATRSLLASLAAADVMLAIDQFTAAENMIESFVHKVDALVNSGRLDAFDAQPLLDAATSALDKLANEAAFAELESGEEPPTRRGLRPQSRSALLSICSGLRPE
ncbi:MAG: VCBS repeat-containing protein [Planctomycetales bacterium]|nr:VCBS repeat-containing protein [Planctomycetales bacterium]